MDIEIPAVLLLVAGLFSIFLVHQYRKDKDSSGYKAAMVLGFLIGIGLLVLAAMNMKSWASFDVALVIVAGFALMIRPIRDADIAIVFALAAMAIVYFYLGTLTGDLAGLADGIPRYVLTLVAGAFVYMVLNFVQKIAQLFGKILNLWPVLFLLGLICLVEGAMMLADAGTLFDFVQGYLNTP